VESYLTEKVHLVRGILYKEKRIRDLVVREPMVADALNAEKKSDGKSALMLSLNLMAERIDSIGDVPKEEITGDLLSGLIDDDFERISEAIDYLKKKARWQNDD
jgi:hypothetical protein